MKKKRPKNLILFGNGINCEYETAHAHRLAGFEDRWVNLKTNKLSHCIFTKDIDNIYLPVRHGEGCGKMSKNRKMV